MIERYKRLNAMTPYLYVENSPIVFEAEVIHKDNNENKVVAQLKLQNISEKTIVACKVKIRAFEIYGNEVEGIEDYSYHDLWVKPGQSFGTKIPVTLPNDLTRIINVYIKQVIFSDYSCWTGNGEEAEDLEVTRIEDRYFDPECIKQCKIEFGDYCKLMPKLHKDLFICACGTVSGGRDRSCAKCGRDYMTAFSLLEPQYISNKTEQRVALERRIERKKRLRKNIIIGSSIGVALVTAITLFLIFWGIPMIRYNKANKLYASNDYDKSIEILTELDTFNDANLLLVEVKYEYAKYLAEHRKYKEALELFEEIRDFDNSDEQIEGLEDIDEKIKETKYDMAESYEEKEMYDEALEILEEIKDFKDTKEKIYEILYKKGTSLLEEKKYDDAARILIDYVNYEDSTEKHYECISHVYRNDPTFAEKYYNKMSDKQKAEMSDYILANGEEGTVIPFGDYNGVIWWRILEKKADTLLLITEEGVVIDSYMSHPGKATWNSSSIRTWLMNTFYMNSFTDGDRSKFVVSTLDNNKNDDDGTIENASTEDRVFLLSVAEAKKYFDSNEDRICPTLKGKTSWWLRTNGSDDNLACCVDDDGKVNTSGTLATEALIVRPAIRISLNNEDF